MTNNDKSAIILKEVDLPFSVEEKTITIKLKMEVCADINDLVDRPYKKLETANENKNIMNAENFDNNQFSESIYKTPMFEMNTNLIEASNYLIQLFYKAGQRYSCSQTKIGKLLSIVAFVYARQNERFLNETIYKYDDCGTAILELRFVVDRDVYIHSEYSDKPSDINDKLADLNDVISYIPNKYLKTSSLSDEIKEVIETVFVKFGAYSAYDLGRCLNLLVNHKDVTKISGEINLCRIRDLKYSDFNETNNLIHFLFSNYNFCG